MNDDKTKTVEAAAKVAAAAVKAAEVVANADTIATALLAEAAAAGQADTTTVAKAATIAAAKVAAAARVAAAATVADSDAAAQVVQTAAAKAVVVTATVAAATVADSDAAAQVVQTAAAKAAGVVTTAATIAAAKLTEAKAAAERDQLQEHLQQTQKMEAVGQLAGGIAHDFNNLLTVISGFTELVLATTDSADSRHADLLEVQKAAGRAAALTRQLLAFSRRQVLQPQVLDVNALVTGIKALLQRTMSEDIELVMALGVVDPVRVDASQLEQVLLNLALNARDAMPDGGALRFVTETVVVDDAVRYPSMKPGRYVRLTVSDTGVGMTPETQARMFEPFFTTKPLGKGTGLGLASVYGIVTQSGGFLRVDSQVGRGTLFAIYFPAVDAAVEPPVRVLIAERVAGGPETILLAEDDDAVRGLVRHMLSAHGYTVLQGCDGDDALNVARQHTGVIHLLVTDVMMPRLSGPALAARLRMERPDIHVLYTSGYADEVTAHAGVERGVQVLGKPFLPVDLLRRVRGILDMPAVTQSIRD